ncbi:MAG: hypothetical protein QXF76_04075 [Candidatus Anstonellales archaeon]
MTDNEKDEYSNLPSWMRKKGISVDKQKSTNTSDSSKTIGANIYSSSSTSPTSSQKIPQESKQQISSISSSSISQSTSSEKVKPNIFEQNQTQQQKTQPTQLPQSPSFNYGYNPYQNQIQSFSSGDIPTIYKVSLAFAIIIALLSLFFAWNSYNYVNYFKNKIQNLAKQLSEINDQEIEFTIPDATYKAKVTKDVPVNTLFTTNFGVPVEMNIPIDTRLTAYTSTGIPVSLNIKDTLYIKDVARIDPKSLNSNVVVKIEADIKGTTPIVGKTRLKDLYGDKIKNITKELEELAK